MKRGILFVVLIVILVVYLMNYALTVPTLNTDTKLSGYVKQEIKTTTFEIYLAGFVYPDPGPDTSSLGFSTSA
ncbi:hypothetical protein BBF96_12685 [Anoxybacter fermentans]|uniref:Uncharacterized protein n=1 Tax=Anoxybacter fermentans TaxID=1323375 RepID=A0A3S9T0P3_9FIRM|nr:hypothetical protein [Anoxybacter fermentans]AZR74176.1 hypothetical protein BBF96_12685 [Anoxybacter fermentans]